MSLAKRFKIMERAAEKIDRKIDIGRAARGQKPLHSQNDDLKIQPVRKRIPIQP